MITLTNGRTIEYVAASGALNYDGRGWPWEQPLRATGHLDVTRFTTVIKTLTRHPREGNLRWYAPWRCVRLLAGGSLNALGLTNRGIDHWCRETAPTMDFTRQSLVGSILSNSVDELVEMTRMLNAFDFTAIELNVSSPNANEPIIRNSEFVVKSCAAMKEVSRVPIIAKLSVTHKIDAIVPQLEGLVEAISINSVPWSMVYPNAPSPMAKLGGGGVSGKIAQAHTWGLAERITKMTYIPVIGPSVWEYEDMEKLRTLGARAVSFGSIFLRYPWRPTAFVKRDQMARDIAADSAASHDAAPEKAASQLKG